MGHAIQYREYHCSTSEKAILKEISDIEIDIIDFNYKITIPNDEDDY